MKTRALSYGITETINSMISIGLKKAEMIELCKLQYIEEHGSKDGWKDYMAMENEHIRTSGSIEPMRAVQKIFCAWAKSLEYPIKKFEYVTRDDLCSYLVYRSQQLMRDGTTKERSAWTVQRDLMFCNKIFHHLTKDAPLTKKELGLRPRLQSQVVRGRGNNGISSNRPGLWQKCKDQILFSRGTGARRESVTEITYSRFRFNKKGMPVRVFLIEKNGKKRWTYILPAYQDAIKKIIEPHKNSKAPIFDSYDSHVNNHRFRHEYAMELLAQVKGEHERGEPYFQGDARPKFKLSKKEKDMKTWRGIDVIVCALVSQKLGHNRVEVLKSYIW